MHAPDDCSLPAPATTSRVPRIGCPRRRSQKNNNRPLNSLKLKLEFKFNPKLSLVNQQVKISVLLLLLVLVLGSKKWAQSSKLLGGSEWNFDNQALRSISSQMLCSQMQSNQTAQDNDQTNRQQVNVVTFIGNQIDSIEPDAFKCVASELRILVLSSNEVDHIPLGAFEGLHSVQVLLLDNNLLTSIPSEASLSPLKSLMHLTLSRSSNHSFSDTPMEGLGELRFLHLDRSRAPKVRLGVTKNLCQESAKLSSLILKSNAIEQVPQFAHCQNLLLLDLSYNNIRGSLSENFAQQQTPNLIDLYLGNNQLEYITDRALIGLRKLQVLELQNNRLKQIEASAFLPVQSTLVELNLSHNRQLDELNSQHLDQLSSLKCYGNDQLRELPHFKSATRLALTYAYHCCDYPWLSGAAEPTDLDRRAQQQQQQQQESSSLIVRLLHEQELQESRGDKDSTRELILWPSKRNSSKRRYRRRTKTTTTTILMDEEFLTELKLIRAEHSVHFSGDEMSNIVPANNRTTRSTRDPNEERKPQPDGSPRMRCLPSPGPFLPCKDLFDSWWLRAGIWSVFLLAFLGNTLVIIVLSSVRQTSSSSALTSIMWLAHSKRHIDVPRFLVINLAIADLLMAVYLGLLAFVDLSTLGEFKLHAIRWQYSTGCKLAGFLAVLSSELSVFILAIITLERNYAITNAVHLNRRLSLQKAMFIMFLGYAFALGMALMPLYGISDYRRFSVCLPLDVDSSRGSQIYVITLISINTFSFVLLLGCYLRMYFAIRGSQAWNANDLRIAKRMSILVVTDFLCWMPIIASGLTSLFGYHLIGTEGMKIMTIFILPLNSVANPFLYAITTKKFKRDLSTLQRRTRALIRLANCADNKLAGSHQHDHHQTNHHHHHHAYLTAGGYKHAASKLHCGHAAANNQQQQPKNNHYRHDLLLMSGQCRAYKGGGGAKNQSNNKLRLVSGVAHKSQAPKLAASKRQSVQRSATPLAGTCLGCSCQQRRQQQQQQDIDERPRQRAQLGPRIVLETATQTSGGQLRRQPASPPVLLRKSRSTNSGLTMMAMRRDEQQTPSTTSTPREQAWALVGVADDADREEAPAGGVLTKIEESMMMSGCDELSLHWNRQPPPPPPRSAVASCEEQAAAAAAVAAEEAEEHEELDDNAYREPPLAVSAGSSLLIQGAAAVRQRSCQSNHRRTEAAAAASRYYLSVDPFFIQTVAGATPTPTAGGNNNIRSASACGHLASCRGIIGADDAGVTTTLYNKCQLSNNKPSRRAGVGGSCDTMRVTSASGGVCTGAGANGDGGSGGGGPIKLSRSIQRLLFGPLAKAWSSIQISLNSSAASTHIGQQQQQQHQYHMNAADHGDGDDGQSATPLGERIDDHDADDECIDIDRMLLNGADCCLVDDILTMSSPLEGCMARIGERRMSRSCDAFIQKPNNNNDLLLGGSPSHSTSGAAGQEQSSSQGGGEYDDDRRVLLATINRLAATGSHRTRLAAGNSGRPAAAAAALVSPTPNLIGRRGGFNQRANGPGLMRGGRCMRCRSWSPALLTKLENCIYQMRSKISSGFVSQNAGATRLESAHDQQDCHSSHHSPGGANLDLVLDDEAATAKHQEASSESELELDAVDDEDVSSDDQFGGEPPTDWASRRQTISKFGRRAKRTGRLRQQSSINSDTLSTRTAGTLITNMSLSSDSSASIQMAVAAAAAAATVTRLDIITDTQGDDDDDI